MAVRTYKPRSPRLSGSFEKANTQHLLECRYGRRPGGRGDAATAGALAVVVSKFWAVAAPEVRRGPASYGIAPRGGPFGLPPPVRTAISQLNPSREALSWFDEVPQPCPRELLVADVEKSKPPSHGDHVFMKFP